MDEVRRQVGDQQSFGAEYARVGRDHEAAYAELARHLLTSDRTADSDVETQGITSLQAGPVSLTFGAAVAKPNPDAVMVMCARLGRPRSRTGSGSVQLYRG